MLRQNLLNLANLMKYNLINKETITYFAVGQCKKHELEDIKTLCSVMQNHSKELQIFENYYVGYKIPQIGKEFDLLKIGSNAVVNIELKHKEIKEDKIVKQLQRNYYYLSAIRDKVYCYVFIASKQQFYYYNNQSESIVDITIEEMLDIIATIDDVDEHPDQLFVPIRYLVSPFNNTVEFLNEQYFLTNYQEEIKNAIINHIDKHTIFSISGSAGTGKTLLTYDIARTLMNMKLKVIIVHCAQINEGINKLNDSGMKIIPIKDFNTKLNNNYIDYDIIIFDESQRICNEMDKIFESLNKKILIFSHDVKQKLNRKNKAEEVVEKIKQKATKDFCFTLTNKIRHNREPHSFTKKLFNFSKLKDDNLSMQDYKNISIFYTEDLKEAEQYIEYLQDKNWKYIYHTPSSYNNSEKIKYIKFNSNTSAHQAIGQEYDNVIVAITEDFYYTQDNKLQYRAKFYYHPIETLFQAITRTKKELTIVIINNKSVYQRCINIMNANKI